MGESILDASPASPSLEDKMGETASSNPVLEVSVSFGRFENDSLSWEKWSSFSPNKYLEEVEKCATPGSVAKKAAYFEAHYKKIAARKAELLDQEKQMENGSSIVDNQTCGDLKGDNCKNHSESDISDCLRSNEVVYQATSLANEVRETLVDEVGADAACTVDCQSLSIEGMKEEKSRLESSALDKAEETVDALSKEVGNASMAIEIVKELQEKDMERTTTFKEEKVKLDRPKDSNKIALVNKERNISRIKKKPASPMAKTSHMAKASPLAKASPIIKSLPIAKAPQFSTPRVSKPVPTSTLLSPSRSSTKIGNGSSLSKSKIFSSGESKKVAPKSLHISLRLGPSSSDPASLTTRKSHFMEKMGDKDIVKRAFKMFQNNYNQLKSANEEQSPAPKQVPSKGAEPRVSALMNQRKENAGSYKAAGVEKKSAKAAPSSLALKNNERAEKRREFSKKPEEKSNAKEAEKPRLHSKSKEDKEMEVKKAMQSLSSKATLTSSSYRGQKISKGSSNKEGLKNEKHQL